MNGDAGGSGLAGRGTVKERCALILFSCSVLRELVAFRYNSAC